MRYARREFLKATAAAAAALALDRASSHAQVLVRTATMPGDAPDLTGLALHAVDAAQRAGASYADVRVTHTRTRRLSPRIGRQVEFDETEDFGLGVRALAGGAFGFASTPYLIRDEVERVAREAVSLAKATVAMIDRPVELCEAPAPGHASWQAPIAIDPFEVSLDELADWMSGYAVYAAELDASLGWKLELQRQRKVFASSGGALLDQRFQSTEGDLSVEYRNIERQSAVLAATARGWEYVQAAPVADEIAARIAEIDDYLRLPVMPLAPGRFDVIFDAQSVGALLSCTLANATDLDRAMGSDVDSDGGSYLNNPPSMLGMEQVGAELLTITADRSHEGGLATAGWDDEGVASRPFTLVRHGVLSAFQLNRESALWLAPWFKAHGGVAQSNGCAAAPSALVAPMSHVPNLAVQPATQGPSLDAMIAGMDDGLLVTGLQSRQVLMDDQCFSGMAVPKIVLRIKRGRRVGKLEGAGMLFRSPQLWKALTVLGGPQSMQWLPGAPSSKGMPPQSTRYSVGAVPARFRDIAVIDPRQR